MRSIPQFAAILACISAAALVGTSAYALPRTFVSNAGSGTACSRAAPCGDFQTAHDATNPGGEIDCLNSGNYVGFNAVHINRSITIDCGGTASTAFASALNAF